MAAKVVMVRAHPVNPDVRIEKEAKSLSDAGYDVTVLCWGRYGGDALKAEKRSGYALRRFKLQAPWGVKVIFYLPLWWFYELVWLMKNDWDIAHAADFDTYIPALLAAKIKRKPIIYDIFDFYADQISLPSQFRKLLAFLDRHLMNFADRIIIVDPSRLTQIGRNDDSSIIVIYNSPSDHLKNGAPLQEKDGVFKIFYAGVLSRDRDFASIIDASTSIEDVSVEIAGYGYYEKEMKIYALNNPKVKFLGALMYDVVIEKSLQADLLFALYDPSVLNNKYASPNKLFEAMMCGKPILVSDKTAMADIVRAENCGLVVPYGDVNAVNQSILTLKNNPDLCVCLGENGRKAYTKRYCWDIMKDRLLEIYDDLAP